MWLWIVSNSRADADVLVHRALPVFQRQGIPRPHLHERVDDEVRGALGDDLAGPSRLRVGRGLRRREVAVRRLEPAGERGGVQGCAELAEVRVPVGDLPEEEVAVRPDACRGVRAQVLETVAPALDHLGEGIFHRGALVDREAAPGGVELVKGVGDVLALRSGVLTDTSYALAAAASIALRTGSRLVFGVPST